MFTSLWILTNYLLIDKWLIHLIKLVFEEFFILKFYALCNFHYQFYNYQLVLIIKIKENIWTIASVTRTTNTISKEKITWNMIWLGYD